MCFPTWFLVTALLAWASSMCFIAMLGAYLYYKGTQRVNPLPAFPSRKVKVLGGVHPEQAAKQPPKVTA